MKKASHQAVAPRLSRPGIERTSAIVTIVLATSNLGKLRELYSLLVGLPIEVLTVPQALGEPLEVVEDGETFQQNAIKKARAVAAAAGMMALADDSGLEVDALGGRPGVQSARFAGEAATDADNNRVLLASLAGRSDAHRGARYRCVLALASPWSERIWIGEGTCEGRIAHAPQGSQGFGYDPLFIATELGERTMAELPPDEKNRVSHRGRAMRTLLPHILDAVNATLETVEQIAR